MVVVSRIYESPEERHRFCTQRRKLISTTRTSARQVKTDYETVRETNSPARIELSHRRFGKTSAGPHQKGRGHGSTTRAFYARPRFVCAYLNLQKLASMPLDFTRRRRRRMKDSRMERRYRNCERSPEDLANRKHRRVRSAIDLFKAAFYSIATLPESLQSIIPAERRGS